MASKGQLLETGVPRDVCLWGQGWASVAPFAWPANGTGVKPNPARTPCSSPGGSGSKTEGVGGRRGGPTLSAASLPRPHTATPGEAAPGPLWTPPRLSSTPQTPGGRQASQTRPAKRRGPGRSPEEEPPAPGCPCARLSAGPPGWTGLGERQAKAMEPQGSERPPSPQHRPPVSTPGPPDTSSEGRLFPLGRPSSRPASHCPPAASIQQFLGNRQRVGARGPESPSPTGQGLPPHTHAQLQPVCHTERRGGGREGRQINAPAAALSCAPARARRRRRRRRQPRRPPGSPRSYVTAGQLQQLPNATKEDPATGVSSTRAVGGGRRNPAPALKEISWQPPGSLPGQR